MGDTSGSNLFSFSDTHDPGGKRRVSWPKDSKVHAVFDGERDCYRYALSETWGAGFPASRE